MRMQNGWENITINTHETKPVNAVRSITRGASLQAYKIEKGKSRNTKRKQETTIRNWEEEPQETPGTKASTKDYGKESFSLQIYCRLSIT